jgi:hypothetical protein
MHVDAAEQLRWNPIDIRERDAGIFYHWTQAITRKATERALIWD